jgi:hypothetical protein
VDPGCILEPCHCPRPSLAVVWELSQVSHNPPLSPALIYSLESGITAMAATGIVTNGTVFVEAFGPWREDVVLSSKWRVDVRDIPVLENLLLLRNSHDVG